MAQKEILILKVTLGEGYFDTISIHARDEPNDLAQSFCKKHNLSKERQDQLEILIEKQIDEIVERDFQVFQASIQSGRSKTPGTPCRTRDFSQKKITNCKKSHALMLGKQSDIFLQQKKFERFTMIFNFLRPGRDGKISSGTIAEVDLELPVFKVISPLLIRIMSKKLVVNFKEFCKEMEILMESMSKENQDVVLYSNNKSIHVNSMKLKKFQRIST